MTVITETSNGCCSNGTSGTNGKANGSQDKPLSMNLKSKGNLERISHEKNPSLQVTADHNIKLVEAPILTPGQGQVLVHVRATGICGSDVHFWKSGAIGELKVLGDCILGHEAAGVVIGLGDGVSNFALGECFEF